MKITQCGIKDNLINTQCINATGDTWVLKYKQVIQLNC